MRQQNVTYWNDNIVWYFNGEFHRDKDLPAMYDFDLNGKLYSIAYYKNYECHRITGPAYIHYERKIKEYSYEGIEYDSLEEMLMMEACR